MITALLIDDEAHCITSLSHDLAMFCPQVTIVKTCQSAREGIEAIRQYNPDLVFLDIEMPGMDGFGLLTELGNSIDFQVVFTTAYNDFVLKAIRANAMDYLMKPIDGAELADAVERVEKQVLTKFREQRRMNNLLASTALPEEKQRIALPDRNKYEFVDPSEICYCKAEGGVHKCVFYG